jgi:hypothetical protein
MVISWHPSPTRRQRTSYRVGAFLVEDFDEVIEAGLLLQEIASGRLGSFFL